MSKLPPPSSHPRSQNHLFVSYSSKDRAFVDQLAEALRKRGYVVWVDFEGIHGGERWRQSIADGLHASLLVLLVLTPESIASEWVEEEVKTALELGKTIIPLLLRPLPETISYPHIAEVYGEVHYRDFRGGFQHPFEQLLADLPTPEVGVPGHCQKLVAELAARPWGLDNYIQEEAKMLPVNASPYEDGVVRGEFRNLLRWLQERQRLMVLGEPGIGKTVALERLAWELANQNPPVLPILVKLLEYDGQPLLEWLRLNLVSRGEIRLADTEITRAFLNDTPYDCYFLLDGLNEVPPTHRAQIVSQITRLGMEFPRFRLAVTSRVQDESWRLLQQGSILQETVLIQPINTAQIYTYLLSHLGEMEGEQLWQQLERDVLMRELATTPLLLWLIKEAWLEARRQHHADRIRMPENRGELYKNFIARMLKRDDVRQLNREVPESVRITALEKLALHMHQLQTLTLDESQVREVMGDDKIVAAIRGNGLLVGDSRLRFAPHQTVQEHFAARALLPEVMGKTRAGFLQKAVRQTLGVGRGVLEHANKTWWAETFIQLAGLTDDPNALAITLAETNPWLAWWCVQEGQQVSAATRQAIESRSIASVHSKDATVRRRAAQALARLQSARTLEPLAELSLDPDRATARTALSALLEMGESGQQAFQQTFSTTFIKNSPLERAEWGRAIAALDPRPGVGLTPAGIPDIAGCEIPAGAFLFGDKGSQQKITLPTFWIAKYPVTYAQYEAFVNNDGYAKRGYWTAAGWQWKGDKTHPEVLWQDPQWHIPNHPVVGVRWYEAVAFCRWLSEKLGVEVRLPTEAEFEKAARGTTDWLYPYGDTFDATKGNTDPTGIGRTSAVGLFPDGASPYGVMDLSGNVWEWSLSAWANPYQAHTADQVDIEGDALRALRGGSWSLNGVFARVSVRLRFGPNFRDDYVGFRVCHLKSGV